MGPALQLSILSQLQPAQTMSDMVFYLVIIVFQFFPSCSTAMHATPGLARGVYLLYFQFFPSCS